VSDELACWAQPERRGTCDAGASCRHFTAGHDHHDTATCPRSSSGSWASQARSRQSDNDLRESRKPRSQSSWSKSSRSTNRPAWAAKKSMPSSSKVLTGAWFPTFDKSKHVSLSAEYHPEIPHASFNRCWNQSAHTAGDMVSGDTNRCLPESNSRLGDFLSVDRYSEDNAPAPFWRTGSRSHAVGIWIR